METKRKPDNKKEDANQGDVVGGVFSSLSGFINNLGKMVDVGEPFAKRPAAKADWVEKEGAAGESKFSRILSGLTDIAEKLGELGV